MTLLSQYYQGFYIDQPLGNNAFSFEQRKNKRIYVPSFIRGSLKDVQLGQEIVFSEIVDGLEINSCGLKHFVHMIHPPSQHVFIVDNHQHAFFCWGCLGLKKSDAMTLVHVDQHKDTRIPVYFLEKKDISLQKIWKYTQDVLNVGNFIPPAVSLGWFSDVIHIGSEEDFLKKQMPSDMILDIDLDIFSSAMSYIPDELKIKYLRKWMSQAKVVTIATSPFFIEQPKALTILHQLF